MTNSQDEKQNNLIDTLAKELDNLDYRNEVVPQMEATPIYFDSRMYFIGERGSNLLEFISTVTFKSNKKALRKVRRRIGLKDILRRADIDLAGQAKLTGHYQSFASINGRAMAKEMAMMSLPKAIKPYLYLQGEYHLVEYDMSNAEIAAAGVVSGDDVLLQDLARPEGIYRFLANLSMEKSGQNGVLRKDGKEALIQLTYGANPTKVKERLKESGLSEDSANHLVNAITSRYEVLWKYLDNVSKSKNLIFNGDVTRFSTEFIEPHKLKNYAIASVVAMTLKQWAVLVNQRWKVVNTVHDSLWLAVPKSETLAMVHSFVVEQLHNAMEQNNLLLPNIQVKQNVLGGKRNVF